jgi:metal-responsive CopG/Arc/MetJ family transcriptional regulator
MKEIKVQFPAEMLEKIDALVGDKQRSKFIRAAVAGALTTAEQVKSARTDEVK